GIAVWEGIDWSIGPPPPTTLPEYLGAPITRFRCQMTPNPIGPWLKRLNRRFSPRRTLVGREGNESLPGGDGDSIEYVIARELCLFAAIDASRVPERERPAFVALAVRRAAPFADPESGVAWTGDGIASTWYWSRGRISELLSGRGQRARRETFVPEALHRGGQREDGAELLAMANGVEGRAWKAGRLVASRWWPQPPPFNDWQAFVRGAGLLPAQEVPAAVDAPLAAKRWGTRPAARSQGLERLG